MTKLAPDVWTQIVELALTQQAIEKELEPDEPSAPFGGGFTGERMFDPCADLPSDFPGPDGWAQKPTR